MIEWQEMKPSRKIIKRYYAVIDIEVEEDYDVWNMATFLQGVLDVGDGSHVETVVYDNAEIFSEDLRAGIFTEGLS